MNKEEYSNFIKLQDEYQAQRQKWVNFVRPIINSILFEDRRISSRYSTSLYGESRIYFSADRVSYTICYGDNSSDEDIKVSDLFSRRFLISLEERNNVTQGLITHRNQLAESKKKAEELELLNKLKVKYEKNV